jgi:hypothetical protein
MIELVEKYLSLLDRRSDELRIIYKELYEAKENFKSNPTFVNRLRLEALLSYLEQNEKTSLFLSQKVVRTYEPNPNILTIYIDREWSAYDFDKVFKIFDFFNKFFVVRQKFIQQESRFFTGETRKNIFEGARLYHYLSPSEELKVTKVIYASPGFINFSGLPEIVSKILDFASKTITFAPTVKKVIDYYYHWKHEKPIQIRENQNKLAQATRKAELDLIEDERKKQEILNSLTEERYKEEKRKLERQKEMLKEFLEISELMENLNKKGIALQEALEPQFVQALSSLHNLGYETGKVKLLQDNDKLEK